MLFIKFHNVVDGIFFPSGFLWRRSRKGKPRRGKTKRLIIIVLPQTLIIIQQIYHSNVRSKINIRSKLQNNSGSNSKLASRFSISRQTVSKWKNRDFLQDTSSKLFNIKYALTDLEKALAISLTTSTFFF